MVTIPPKCAVCKDKIWPLTGKTYQKKHYHKKCWKLMMAREMEKILTPLQKKDVTVCSRKNFPG